MRYCIVRYENLEEYKNKNLEAKVKMKEEKIKLNRIK